MKRLLIATFLISALAASDSFAQMGHGMMREIPEGMMHEHMMVDEGMMSREQMMNNMTDMMNELSGLMGNMSEIMKYKPKEDMLRISVIMRDMSFEIRRMSDIIDKETVTDKELNIMKDDIMQMKKRMSEIKQ